MLLGQEILLNSSQGSKSPCPSKLSQIPEATGQGHGPCRPGLVSDPLAPRQLPLTAWGLAESRRASLHPLILPSDKHGCQAGATMPRPRNSCRM